MAMVIAIANQKGGVAKTTTTINIGYGLMKLGGRVLLIDNDPQGSLTLAMGVPARDLIKLDSSGKTFYYGLAKDIPLSELIMQREEKLDLLPAYDTLNDAEVEIRSAFGVATILRKKLLPLREVYDFILIDCPPDRSFLTINALAAANKVVIPCKTDYLSVMGIPRLLQTIDDVRVNANPNLDIVGIIPTMFNASAGHDKEIVAQLKVIGEQAQVRVFEPIHRSTNFDKSAIRGIAALELAPETRGIAVYSELAQTLYGK